MQKHAKNVVFFPTPHFKTAFVSFLLIFQNGKLSRSMKQ